ncbi:MAG: hypothetical protein RSB69_10260 [Odoribacter sp.]
MTTIIKIGLSTALVFLLIACYQDEKINPETIKPKYEVKDSHEPVDHYIYEFYQKHGIFILYDYQDADYKWNISSLMEGYFVKQTDKTILKEGLDFIERSCFKYYDDKFLKNYFPFKILMADSIQQMVTSQLQRDQSSLSGVSYLAIGKIRSGISTINKDSLNYLKGEIQATLWTGLVDNEIIELPDTYWAISDIFYTVNLKNLDENEKINFDKIDVKKYGFWERDKAKDSGKRYCMAPNRSLDITQFINMITTHTKAEMTALMKSSNKLKDKYNLLTSHVKSVYGIDLQAIGEDK